MSSVARAAVKCAALADAAGTLVARAARITFLFTEGRYRGEVIPRDPGWCATV